MNIGAWLTASTIVGAILQGLWTIYQWRLARRRAEAEQRAKEDQETIWRTQTQSGLEFHADMLADHAERIGRLEQHHRRESES